MITSRKHFTPVTVFILAFLLSISTQYAGKRSASDRAAHATAGAATSVVAPAGDPCGGSCDDGDACTTDTCDGSECQNDEIACDDSNVCNGSETCNPVSGCESGLPLLCDDFDACNGTETCDPATGCVPGTPLECDDFEPCNGVETCDPGSGCGPGTPPSCDDFDACTTDGCEPFVGCNWQAVTCDDFNDCTDDSCAIAQGCIYTSNDTDGDGICPVNNCPDAPNPDQTDSDGDGLGDACDPCVFDPNNDLDADGYCESDDNCPVDFNPDQFDSDKDGAGDPCDPCPVDSANDADSDGSCGDVNNCPTIYNPGQEDGDSDGLGDACAPFRVDFCPFESQTADGFAGDDGFLFDPWRGFGWDGPVSSRERGVPIPQEFDTFIFTRDPRRWTVELPNGDYDVHVICGDPVHFQGPQRVTANGMSLLDDVTSDAGTFVDRTTRVAVRNGRLDLTFGGAAGNTLINWAEAILVSEGPAFLRSISFQSGEEDSAAGFEPDYCSEFDEGRGYGWDGEYECVSQGSSAPTVLDSFARISGYGTWNIEVPAPGYYEVWLSAGDALAAAGPHRVTIEGNPVLLDESTAAGQFLERHSGALVVDGHLTVEVGWFDDELRTAGLGDVPQATTLNYIVLASASEDSDGDFVLNEFDLCPFASDPDQIDSDEDGSGDACDPDLDGDGVENPNDVCSGQFDPSQEDSDQDGFGDACDTCALDPFNDSDGDGVCGLSDNCRDVHNSGQEDHDGDGLGDACSVLRVNFAPPGSPAPVAFVSDYGTTFDWFLGRGWDAAMATRDRRTAAPPELDTFVFSSSFHTWRAELPNGNYRVTASIGDASYPQGPQHVSVQGSPLFDGVVLSANEFASAPMDVSVRNGRLELSIGPEPIFAETSSLPNESPFGGRAVIPNLRGSLADDGGIDGLAFGAVAYTTINWVEAIPLGPPNGLFRSFNFQPAASDPPPGTEIDSGAVFTLARGHGWNVAVPTRERGLAVPQVLDTFAFASPSRTWEVELPSGLYRVFLSVGDARYPQGPQRVVIEGSGLVNDESTQAGSFIERDAIVFVSDGRLTIQIGGGGSGGNTCLNYVTIQSEFVSGARR